MNPTTNEMLEEQIREALEDLEQARFLNDSNTKPLLDKLQTLYAQKFELDKIASENLASEKKLELEERKLETDAAIRIRELELKEEQDKVSKELEEMKIKEQKRSNTTSAVIGGVTAATGVATLAATVHCFRKSMIFEETGSYTNKSSQAVGGLFNLFKKR